MKQGLLLVNLGTPNSPHPPEVGKYLREFLMDPLVVDIHAVFRWILVNLLIVPRRAKASSELYKKVWEADGSPLLSHSRKLTDKVAQKLKQGGENVPFVKLAMRYGDPSIGLAIDEFKKEGVTDLRVLALYPQYSLAATESSVQKVKAEVKRAGFLGTVTFCPPFYNSPAYLDAVAAVSLPYLRSHPHDLVLFSFHGLPERQIKKTDPSQKHCLQSEDCCAQATPANTNCYRFQCYETARQLALRLQINPLRYLVGFQSRLGVTPWIQPYSDAYYETLPSRGIKRLVVLSPSFVADCLETVEEIQIRGKKQFLAAGGEALTLVPSLNSDDRWAEAVLQLLHQSAIPSPVKEPHPKNAARFENHESV